MGMVINNNLDSIRVYNAYSKNALALSDSTYKVSTAKKINFSADDPSGLAMATRIRTRIDSSDQAKRNLQSDTAIMRMADGALSNLHEILSSMREKVVSAANTGAAGGSADRKLIADDVAALITEYSDVVDDAQYRGQKFFDTDATSFASLGFYVQYGADSGDSKKFTFEKLDGTTLSITASKISNKMTKASVTGSAIASLVSKIDTAINKVAAQQAKMGTYEQRLGYLSDNRTNETTALTELESGLRDLDMAKGMTDFMKYNVQTQASQIMLAQTGQNASMVLRLLE